MILAGIDEAGYGPLLGPLVVGCCAFEVEDDSANVGATPPAQRSDAAGCIDQLPCLWKRLKKLISKNRTKAGKKLHVNDSKIVYQNGLKELERAILALIATRIEQCEGLEHLLALTANHVLDDVKQYPWYRPFDGERFPLEQDFLPIRLFANALRQEMDKSGCHCVYLGARIVTERRLNDLLNSTNNKGSALFSTAAIHLDHLLRTYGQQNLVIFCDRQGGRAHYGSLLRLMFDDWALEIIHEEESRAEYRLLKKGHAVRILFCEKAETQCLPVAVASMLSKYLREALMTRFNAFWKQHLPQLEPTAGYYADGVRFLGDINDKRLELGIADEQLIRSR